MKIGPSSSNFRLSSFKLLKHQIRLVGAVSLEISGEIIVIAYVVFNQVWYRRRNDMSEFKIRDGGY